MICKCIGSDADSETPNYPKIGHSSSMYFESIPRVPYPITKNASEFLVSFSVVMMPDSISDYDWTKQYEIIGHKNFWSLGISNRSHLYLDLATVT